MNAFVTALVTMAAEERMHAAIWRQVARATRTPYLCGFLGVESWAREHDARAEIYETWAQALSFPGGPVHPDFIRYGASRDSVAS